MAPVPLTAVCFRVNSSSDADHAAILTTLAAEGTALLGPASLHGRKGIRACITNYRTTRADIDLIIEHISQLLRRLWRP